MQLAWYVDSVFGNITNLILILIMSKFLWVFYVNNYVNCEWQVCFLLPNPYDFLKI